MSKRNTSKLSSWFDSSQYSEDLSKIDDILEMPVNIKGVVWRNGQNGQYAIITLDILETGSELKVSSGGMAVCDMLRAAEANRAFPFQCKFTKNGRMFIPTDVE